ncbi:hypothetical protein [Tropicimonas marinistellae]|uniref:hypothetical protein n=1 Tax=Tropicimonas marinistellae TaxID=1739787 RepID=UPI000836E848|nr:hypothetical protein [Tropicimonas marinistellae]
MPQIIAATDLMATAPVSVAEFTRQAGCDVHPVPLELSDWGSEMVWTQKSHASALERFLVKANSHAASLTKVKGSERRFHRGLGIGEGRGPLPRGATWLDARPVSAARCPSVVLS